MPRIEERERQHTLPPVVEEIDQLLTEQEAWRPPRDTATAEEVQADRLEKEALDRQVAAKLKEAGSQVEMISVGLHAWLRKLAAEHETAKAEVQRAQFWAGVRGRKLDRAKAYVMELMRALRVERLEGATWRLRLQANGGRTPIAYVRDEPLPAKFAKRVDVEPQRVADVLFELDVKPSQIDSFFRRMGINPNELEADSKKVYSYLEEHGDLPDGFVLEPKGQHLRVE